MNKKIIEAEKNKFKKLNDIELKESKLTEQIVESIFSNYNCTELSTHYYDLDPPECKKCKKSSCYPCEFYDNYKNSEKRFNYCTWIDLITPEVCEISQNTMNKLIKEELTEIANREQKLDDKETTRTYLVFSTDKKEICIYYYYRDGHDYGEDSYYNLPCAEEWYHFVKKGSE